MRARLCLFAVALAAFLGMTQGAGAAYQVLALVAGNEAVPLDCRDGECAAEFSTLCLQPTRGSPPRGVRYRPVGGDGISIVATTTDGRRVEFSGNDHLQVVALRSHVAVRISLPVGRLEALGLRTAAVRVGADVSLVPEPIVGDSNPQTPKDIAVATGPLRRIATRMAEESRDTVTAAGMANDLVNRLPSRGRLQAAAQESLWHEVAGKWTQRTNTDAAHGRARAAYTRCRDTALAQYFTLRQCMGSMHDNFMGEINNAYWNALKVGS